MYGYRIQTINRKFSHPQRKRKERGSLWLKMSVSSTNQLRKIYSRRRVVAINFLSNISLDGSPTSKDLVQQRITRYSGRNGRSEETDRELAAAKGACVDAEDESKKEQFLLGECRDADEQDVQHQNDPSAVMLPPVPSSGKAQRQRHTSAQYKRSASSNDSDAPASPVTTALPVSENRSAVSFFAPSSTTRILATNPTNRRQSSSETTTTLGTSGAAGARLKAQLNKLDSAVTCSFDALRAFGLVRAIDKKAVVSFGALLLGDSSRANSLGQQPLAMARLDSVVSPYGSQSTAKTPRFGVQSQLCLTANVSNSNLKKSKNRTQSSTAATAAVAGSHHEGQLEVYSGYKPLLFDEMAALATSRASRLSASQSELKRMMNENFRLRFPDCQLTLSKLQSLKRELAQIGRKCALEPAVIACAVVLFERLVLAALIRKDNRKPCCGACVLLSAKLSDVRDEQLTSLVKELEQTFRIARRELLAYEVAVLVALEFNISVPPALAWPHYERLFDVVSGSSSSV